LQDGNQRVARGVGMALQQRPDVSRHHTPSFFWSGRGMSRPFQIARNMPVSIYPGNALGG
jgi:hypothetical protein